MKESNKLAIAKGKVLQFEQNGDFYLRRGQNKLDGNRLPDAIAMYRMALRRDPENIDAKLALAEALTEACRFDESNRLLFTLLHREDTPNESFFGLGCNFVGLQEYDSAVESFEQYLDLEPDGEFAPDACDMLDVLDEQGEGLIDAAIEQEDMAADKGRELLERDDYKGAIRVLERLLNKQPDLTYARNNLALAYFCDHNYKAAIEQAGMVLKTEPDNIQAHCNLTIFLRATHDKEGVAREAEYIANASSDDTDDLNRICITLMELGLYKSAYSAAKKLMQRMPYDTGIIHRYAVCACENGEVRRALECYDRLLKLDDRDSVARYYRGVCRAALAGAPKPRHGGFMLNYQVPLDEMLARVHRLNETINRPHDELVAAWQGGTELESLVRWGIELPERGVRHALLALVASIGDKRAEEFLRDFVLQRSQPPELKREALGLLKQMGASEPYVGYIDGRIVESKVNLVRCLKEDVPDSYQEVMDACFMLMQGERSEECMLEAANVWGEYVGNLAGYPRLSEKKIYAFAAALEYIACREKNDSVTKGALCKKYGVTLVRFNAALAQLMSKEQH